MTLDHVLSDEESETAFDQAWNEVFGKDARKNGSIHDQIFLAHFYMGEKRLENLRQLDLFRKSQQLQDYRKAEDALKRGWVRWMELEFGLAPAQGKDKLKIRQYQLLKDLRRNQTRESRQEILSRYSVVIGCSAKKQDDTFLQLLGHALDDPARKFEGTNDFAHVSLV
jgi:hypothetical protein